MLIDSFLLRLIVLVELVEFLLRRSPFTINLRQSAKCSRVLPSQADNFRFGFPQTSGLVPDR